MTRGIHLKHLTATDLGLLGLSEERLREPGSAAETAAEGCRELAAEADPVLSRLTEEVRHTLEEALVLLEQALAVGRGLRPG